MIAKNAKVIETHAGKTLRRRFNGAKVAYIGTVDFERTYNAGTVDEQTGVRAACTRYFATREEAASDLAQMISMAYAHEAAQ